MRDVAGIPYFDARFDKNGVISHVSVLPAGTTDLVVISHGWNNSDAEAHTLYTTLFQNFVAIGKPDLTGRALALVGVIWPSKKFDELVAVSSASAGGSTAMGHANSAALMALSQKLDSMRAFFTEPAQQTRIEEARALLPNLEEKGSARRQFVAKMRDLLNAAAADKEDASTTFFNDDGNDIMQRLQVDEDDLDDDVPAVGGSACMNAEVLTGANATEGAAGLKSFLSGAAAAAMNVLNYTTYYEMKTRAGVVGRVGLAKLIDQLANSVQSIHLVGHSFGGRVVTAGAAASTTDKIKSMTLLQAAFSHNGFSRAMSGAFRSVVDNHRVHGPILISYTKNDKAVGIAYPLASRLSGDKTAAFGDEHDVFGGLGRNGAQRMENGETVIGKLLEIDGTYAFEPGKFFNLEASQFISDHGAVTGKQIAYALRKAIAG